MGLFDRFSKKNKSEETLADLIKNARKETNDATYWYNEARRVGADTDKRTKIVKSSTIDAVRYLKNPNDDRWQIYKR